MQPLIFGLKTPLSEITNIVLKIKSSSLLGMPTDLGQVEITISDIKSGVASSITSDEFDSWQVAL
jgi:hypothetical protein